MDKAGEIFGTVFDVDGTWYLRHQGGGGVLIPIEAPESLRDTFASGVTYSVEGHIGRNHLGCPERCYARAGRQIGR